MDPGHVFSQGGQHLPRHLPQALQVGGDLCLATLFGRLVDLLPQGLNLPIQVGIVEEVEGLHTGEERLQLLAAPSYQPSVAIQRTRYVGGELVDQTHQLSQQVAHEAIDHLRLLLAQLGHVVPLHLVELLLPLLQGRDLHLMPGRCGFPLVVHAVRLQGILGDLAGQRDVREAHLIREPLADRLIGRDPALYLSQKARDEDLSAGDPPTGGRDLVPNPLRQPPVFLQEDRKPFLTAGGDALPQGQVFSLNPLVFLFPLGITGARHETPPDGLVRGLLQGLSGLVFQALQSTHVGGQEQELIA